MYIVHPQHLSAKERKAISNANYYKNHKEEIKEYQKKYHQENQTKVLAKMRKYIKERRLEQKVKVLTHYGNGICKCCHCGFNDIRALSIDHINGRGGKGKKATGGTGHELYMYLIKNNMPEGFQCLCMNCQFIKRHTDKEQ
jgi:hypothetical protein